MEGCSGVEAAAVAVAESGGEGVEARELTGRIDPEMRIILGVGRKNSPEDYSGGRRAAAMVGEGWPAVEYERGGIEVMDREIKQFKRSRIPIIKVRWNSKRGPEFTWEREDQFKQKYPHLFSKTAPSSSAAS
ncbi:hypothetical protein Tco_1126274 [Tanacetum coccineum]